MATTRPFAYNTGSLISGTTQVGNLAVGFPVSGFTNSPQFWNGPDESWVMLLHNQFLIILNQHKCLKTHYF